MKSLRTRLFSALIVLLLLGGFSHELWGRILDHDHRVGATTGAENYLDTGSDDNGCNHQCCHHGYPIAIVFADLTCLSGVLEIGSLANPFIWVPDAMPQGIDHPPQIS